MKFLDDLYHWLPDELMNAQRNGELLLFCGAGVSKAVGVPDFYELVDNIANNLFNLKNDNNDKNNPAYSCHGEKDDEFTNLMQKKQYDRAIFHLENKSSDFDRKRLIEYLKKELIKESISTQQHQIILELASSSEATRLVTTNFDNLFEKARKELTNSDNIKIYDAPLIPMANPKKWSGIIKIHGSLDMNNKNHSDEIVFSSSDFGRAYLTEKWASQFVVEMFMHFHVLFIGYSISDPIFRYIIDAIAIDKQSERIKSAYIFLRQPREKNYGDTEPSYNGLKKIFYNHTGDDKDHSDLYKKLEEWLKDYTVGSVGTKEIITSLKSLQNINNKDNVAKLLKHLKNNHETIKYFVENDNKDKTDIAWLPALDKDIVTPHLTNSTKLTYNQASIDYLSTWLVSNLDKYQVIDWLLKTHYLISPTLHDKIHFERTKSNYSNKYDGILNILLNKTLLSVDTPKKIYFSNYLCNKIKKTATTFSIELKTSILECLRPNVTLQDRNLSSTVRDLLDKDTVREEDITKELIERCYEGIFKSTTYPTYYLKQLHAALVSSKLAFADLSIDIIGLLKDAFDLICLITKSKATYYAKEFVAPQQDEATNYDYYPYLYLMNMARDSLKALLDTNQRKGLILLEFMMLEGANIHNSYPVLFRIALYLLDNNTDISTNDKMRLVLPTIKYWLYETDCKREASDFIKNIWLKLTHKQQEKVWNEIRAKIKEIDKNNDNNTNITVIELCRRILWIRNIENNIPNDMVQFLLNYPYNSENDSFLYSDHQQFKVQYGASYDKQIEYTKFTSYGIQEHMELLKKLNDSDDFYQPNNAYQLWSAWAKKDFAESLSMLQKIVLTDGTSFYSKVWKILIYGLCKTAKNAIEFKPLFEQLLSLKDSEVQSITNPICLALQKCSESQNLINFDKNLFIAVFVKILPFTSKFKLAQKKKENDTLYTREENHEKIWYDDAINHEIGYITQALINLLISKSSGRYCEESLSFSEYFNNLWIHVKNEEVNIYVKTIFTCHLYALYILIPQWTKQFIIPLLSWEDNKQDTYQYWYPYLSYNRTPSQDLVKDIKYYLLSSLDKNNLEYFTNPDTRSNLINLAISLWREGDKDFKCIANKLIETEDRATAVRFFEYKIRSSKNKKIINEEYNMLRGLIKTFTTTKKPVNSELSYWIVRTLLVTPYNIYQEEWDSFWTNIIGYINKSPKILFITDRILYIDNGHKVFDLWQELEFLLKILNKIIDPTFYSIGKLGYILQKTKSKWSENKSKLDNNKEYKNLCDIYTKYRQPNDPVL